MNEFLLLRLDAPLQAWGDVAMDPRRPTRDFPSRSGLAGLLASAIGWRYRDAERTTRLQDSLRFAVREDRAPRRIVDFQTADLTRETAGWTRWGVEKRGGASIGTHILHKEYLAGGAFTVALGLDKAAPATLEDVGGALEAPARPLFLGRKNCLPAGPILIGRTDAPTTYAAVLQAPLVREHDAGPLRCWFDPVDAPSVDGVSALRQCEVWDRRDFLLDRFTGSRMIAEVRLPLPEEHCP